MTIQAVVEQDVSTPSSSPKMGPGDTGSMSVAISDFSLGVADATSQLGVSSDSDFMSCTLSSSTSDSSSDSAEANTDSLEPELIAEFIETVPNNCKDGQTVINGISPSMQDAYYSPKAFKAIVEMLLGSGFEKVLFLLPGGLEVFNDRILKQEIDSNTPDIVARTKKIKQRWADEVDEIPEQLKKEWTAEITDPVNLAGARKKTEEWRAKNSNTLERILKEDIFTYDDIENEPEFQEAYQLVKDKYQDKKAKSFRNQIEMDAEDYCGRMGEKSDCPAKYQTPKAKWLAISYRQKEIAGFLYFALKMEARLFIYPSKEAKSFRALRTEIVPSLKEKGKLKQDFTWHGLRVKEKKPLTAEEDSSQDLSPPSSPSRSHAGSIDRNIERLERKQKQLAAEIEQLNRDKRTIKQKLQQTFDPAEHDKLKKAFAELLLSNEELKIKLRAVEKLVEENAEKLAQEKAEKLVQEKAEKIAQEKIEKYFQERLAFEKYFQEKFEKLVQERVDSLVQERVDSLINQSYSFGRVTEKRYSIFTSSDSIESKRLARRQSIANRPEEQTSDNAPTFS